MTAKSHPRRDFIQNITITLLTVSAVVLLAKSQFYSLGFSASSHYFSHFTGTPVAAEGTLRDQSPLIAPVRVAVTGTYGRYGNVSLTTADSEFEPLGTLLSEVLGSSRAFMPSSERAFLHALSDSSSVYYDFCTPLPLSVLAGIVGVTLPEDDLLVQRLVVSVQDTDDVNLYLWDNKGNYLQCTSAVSSSTLLDAVNHYELGDAFFALDNVLPDSEHLAPLSLFLEEQSDLPILTASSALGSSDWLLSAMNFNPRTNLRYPDPDGTEVIVEGERTLRIRTGGRILYQSGGEPILCLPGTDHTPSLREAAMDTGALLNNILGDSAGEGTLYLRSIQQAEGGKTTLEFDYQVDGIPVRFSDGLPAAKVLLTGNMVDELTLRFRQYTSSIQSSLLLPLRQAMAVAGQHKGSELSIGYVDCGSETVSAQWLNQ